MKSDQLPVLPAAGPTQSETATTADAGYWRSVNQLTESAEFEEHLQREFPQAASEFPEGVSRRRWLKLMGASLALSGAAGCRYGPNEIASLVVRPENTIPGVPKRYASSFELAGRAVHLMITNVDGRPIKAEGNANHPLMKLSEPNNLSGGKERFASAGTDVFSQGCVLGLYDPDRTSSVYSKGDSELAESSWDDFGAYINGRKEALAQVGGEGLAVVLSPSLSPTVNRLVAEVAKAFPKATFVSHSAIDTSAQSRACAEAAGDAAELLYDLSAAHVICCLDADLLGNDPNSVLYSRQFSKGRKPDPAEMNRLYSVESRYSVTGGAADSRFALKSSQIGAFVAKLEKRVGELLEGGQAAVGSEEPAFDKIEPAEQLTRVVEAMAEDLVAHKGHSLVAVGAHQPFEVQMAALRLNKTLGNFGATLNLMPSRSAVEGVEPVGLDVLTEKLADGSVTDAWILGDNPVYSVPGNMEIGSALEKLGNVVYFSEFLDETAAVSSWVLPLAHPLECWGDVRGVDGSYGVGQPQILPLLGGKSTIEILAMILGQEPAGESLVMETAKSMAGGAINSRKWRETLHVGFMEGVSAEPLTVGSVESPLPIGELTPGEFGGNEVEVVVATSDTLYDGRFAKNVWMQELPQAMTKLVWDNAAIVSPKTAEKLGLSQSQRSTTERLVLTIDERRVELPVFIMPGQAMGSITVHMGYGRVCRDEAVSSDDETTVGTNVAPLRPANNSQIITGVKALGNSKLYKLATTQDHFAIDPGGLEVTKERAAILAREGTVKQITEGGHDYVEHLGTHHPELESLWDEPMVAFENDDTVPYQWGMTIDLNKCTGCNSCVVACQAENNIPVVGKEQVSRGREMHWIRVDRYFRGDVETPKIVNQPLACVHCETAPCEQVCPVAATVHTEEGINAMAYNRCIGTRYCANNCPYKVRRFNYFNYNTEYGYFYGWQQKGKLEEASRKLQQLVLNPEVTVRGRGVMEKCTYCIQRIQNGKVQVRAEGRRLEDGEVRTACQEACPTQAIVFGDLKDPNSEVSKLQKTPRAYAMLAELNVKPRTLYLARVRNTHPRLMTEDQLKDPHEGHGSHGETHSEGGHAGEAEHSEESHEEAAH
ncbi:MAG: TAT-variant-translocated molybdopterin oxidoreductase [Pirellulaceae bacterium]